MPGVKKDYYALGFINLPSSIPLVVSVKCAKRLRKIWKENLKIIRLTGDV
jgi:hypothetical protein